MITEVIEHQSQTPVGYVYYNYKQYVYQVQNYGYELDWNEIELRIKKIKKLHESNPNPEVLFVVGLQTFWIDYAVNVCSSVGFKQFDEYEYEHFNYSEYVKTAKNRWAFLVKEIEQCINVK
jgi:hypothetical protein